MPRLGRLGLSENSARQKRHRTPATSVERVLIVRASVQEHWTTGLPSALRLCGREIALAGSSARKKSRTGKFSFGTLGPEVCPRNCNGGCGPCRQGQTLRIWSCTSHVVIHIRDAASELQDARSR